LAELERKGLVKRRQGVGTFVSVSSPAAIAFTKSVAKGAYSRIAEVYEKYLCASNPE
jgi:DNA-binding GntR family transcriptional regulator